MILAEDAARREPVRALLRQALWVIPFFVRNDRNDPDSIVPAKRRLGALA
ncbi:MAG: hypothetical protein LBV61_10895 [Burkholderiaceae bacterium]|jgi:hypothetical protein|nr:hypothetical protein [Burkholderiaceae bacterium]